MLMLKFSVDETRPTAPDVPGVPHDPRGQRESGQRKRRVQRASSGSHAISPSARCGQKHYSQLFFISTLLMALDPMDPNPMLQRETKMS